jgi:hypothetical protein
MMEKVQQRRFRVEPCFDEAKRAGPGSAGMGDAKPAINADVPGNMGMVVLVGLGLLVLGGFLMQIYTSNDMESEGLADASSWILWLGATIVGAGIALAGLTASAYPAGARVALLIAGAYFLMNASGSLMRLFMGF